MSVRRPETPEARIIVESEVFVAYSTVRSAVPSDVPVITSPFICPFRFPPTGGKIVWTVVGPDPFGVTRMVAVHLDRTHSSSAIFPLLRGFVVEETASTIAATTVIRVEVV